MQSNNERFPFNQIHESAIIYPGVQIGRNNVIGPYCIIGSPPEWKGKEEFFGRVMIGNNNVITGHATIDSGSGYVTIIGNGCYLLKAVHVGHDARIGDNVTLSCHAIIGGHTVVNDHANLGLGCIIHQKQEIAEGVMIGMGAIVTKKLITEEYKTYAGNPAKEIGDNKKHPNYDTYIINQRQTI